MDKAAIDSFTPEQRVKVAVAYLIRSKDERPEGLENLFGKLEICEQSAKATNMAISQGREALSHLETKFYHLMGSIDTLSDLIADGLKGIDEKVILSWCEKYQMPANMPKMQPGVDIPGNADVPAGNIDIAGSTSH